MKPISSSLVRRQDFIKLFLLGILLAFALSLLASYVYEAIGDRQIYALILSVILTLLPLGYAIKLALSSRSGSQSIDAIVIFHKASENMVGVDRYKFSEDLKRVVIAITSENSAFKEILSEDLFYREKKFEIENPHPNNKKDKEDGTPKYVAIVEADSNDNNLRLRSSVLLVEAIEFILLNELSLHLSSYFDNQEKLGESLIQLTREHIPDVLLKNRVLALLTAPIEERPIFRKSGFHKNLPQGTVHSIWSSEGVIFERFFLTLPSGSKLDRPELGRLVLTTKRGVVQLTIECNGANANLPHGFKELYLGDVRNSFLCLQVNIKIETHLKPLALLSSKGWNYYHWMDSFAERISKTAHFPDFLTQIGWDYALTKFIVDRQIARTRAMQIKSGDPPRGQDSYSEEVNEDG